MGWVRNLEGWPGRFHLTTYLSLLNPAEARSGIIHQSVPTPISGERPESGFLLVDHPLRTAGDSFTSYYG